jgi:hypothetical protein
LQLADFSSLRFEKEILLLLLLGRQRMGIPKEENA